LLLASLLPLSAEDWTTEDGHVYHNVTVLGQEDDGVRITYDGGVGKVPYYELPADLQKRFGQDIDTLAAKKHAVDQAVNDAVQAATASQVVEPAPEPVQPAYTPPPGANPANPGTAQNPGTGPVAPNPLTPGAVNPSGAGPSGGAASGPQGSAGPAGPGGAANKPGQPAAPGAHNPATVVHAPSGPSVPTGGGAVELPSLEMPVSHTPNPGLNGAGGKPLQLSVANYSYNASLDVCYLDSPPLDVTLFVPGRPPAPAPAPGQGSSLTLRVVTDGRTPQQPDRYEMTFVCVGGTGGDFTSLPIAFNSDTGPIPVADTDRKDAGALPGGGQPMRFASFYLSAPQVHQFAVSKELSFTVGPDTYRIDDRGAAILRNYLGDTDTLEPATSSLLRSFYKMLGRIPSFFSIISTICEYVILGSFALLVAASIAAFILGISRFIKM
jgi:hypothetical protein